MTALVLLIAVAACIGGLLLMVKGSRGLRRTTSESEQWQRVRDVTGRIEP